MSWMCNRRVKIQILKKIVKNWKSIVQNLYCNSYCLHCKQTYFRNSSLFSGICPCVAYGCFYHHGWMWPVLLYRTWIIVKYGCYSQGTKMILQMCIRIKQYSLVSKDWQFSECDCFGCKHISQWIKLAWLFC